MNRSDVIRYTLSIFGRDRPGIVAAVARALADGGCNLEDASMTILRGHFAMMLVVTAPAGRRRGGSIAGGPAADTTERTIQDTHGGTTAQDAGTTVTPASTGADAARDHPADGPEALLAPVAARLDLQVNARPLPEDAAPPQGLSLAEPYAVAVYGADRPGIVAVVAGVLAGHAGNITGLRARVVGESGGGDPVYVTHFDVDLPPGSAARVEADLRAAAAGIGVDVGFHPDDADVL